MATSVAVDDHRERLEIMRDLLTVAMESADDSVLAQVAGQLRQVLRELAELPNAEGKSARERFAERVAKADASSSSA